MPPADITVCAQVPPGHPIHYLLVWGLGASPYGLSLYRQIRRQRLSYLIKGMISPFVSCHIMSGSNSSRNNSHGHRILSPMASVLRIRPLPRK